MPIPLLYCCVALIWGSTWYVITLQLGVVEPLVSVIYRFALASLILMAWCWFKGVRLRLSRQQHVFIALQGSMLFGLNYWVLYEASRFLTSGLIAAVFSTMVFFNALNGRLLLAMPIRIPVVVGGVVGLSGIVLLFLPEFSHFSWAEGRPWGLVLALFGTGFASLGNIAAARNTAAGLSVTTINAWGMVYGTVGLVAVSLLLGVEYRFDWRPTYVGALLYLGIPGTILAFAGYLRLITHLGPDRAAYMSMVVPVIALLFSSWFEAYQWSLPAIIGISLILLGNWLALGKKSIRARK